MLQSNVHVQHFHFKVVGQDPFFSYAITAGVESQEQGMEEERYLSSEDHYTAKVQASDIRDSSSVVYIHCQYPQIAL